MPEKQRYYFYGAPLRAQLTPNMSLNERLQITGNNTGNLFIAYAVERHLGFPDESQLFGHEIDVDRINHEYDKLVIPASNFVNSYSDLGGVANILKKLKIPLVVIGIGSQASKFTDKIELKNGTIEFLRVLSEKSVSLGVRGNFTAEKLFDIGIKNVDVIGCPTIYYNSDPKFAMHKKPLDGKIKAAITFGRRKENLHLLQIAIKERLAFIAQSELLELSVMERSAGAKEIARDPLYKKTNIVDPEALATFLQANGRVFYNLPEWISEIVNFDFVLGPRLHGDMIAFQNGVPALWFTHDTRTTEICDLAKLPNLPIEEIENYKSAKEFYEYADFSEFNKHYPLLYNNYLNFLERNGLQHGLLRATDGEDQQWNQLYSFDQYQRRKMSLFEMSPVVDSGTVIFQERKEKTKNWENFISKIKQFVRIAYQYVKITRHPLFDRNWYTQKYLKQGSSSSKNPAWDYLEVGWKKGKSPGPLFDSAWYRRKYPDVAEAEIEPLLHYLTIGWREGRLPNILFDAPWYRKNYAASLSSDTEPFTHYLRKGWKKGFNPNPFFDVNWYMREHPEVTGEPLTHYITVGWKNGFNPSPGFDAQAYLMKFPDVKASGMEPLTHYLRHGKKEKRNI